MPLDKITNSARALSTKSSAPPCPVLVTRMITSCPFKAGFVTPLVTEKVSMVSLSPVLPVVEPSTVSVTPSNAIISIMKS